jgi:hypothetical protein
MADVPEDVQRWTARRRVARVLRIVRGETSVAEAARKTAPTRIASSAATPTVHSRRYVVAAVPNPGGDLGDLWKKKK